MDGGEGGKVGWNERETEVERPQGGEGGGTEEDTRKGGGGTIELLPSAFQGIQTILLPSIDQNRSSHAHIARVSKTFFRRTQR